jgi:hypothetical protein
MNARKWSKQVATGLGLCLLASPALGSNRGLHHEFDEDAAGPNPSQVHIHSIAYAGSGCPAGSVSESVSPDAKAFTLLFDSYVAEGGPGILLKEGRKNCQIAVDLRFPQGWSYTVVDVDYRGYVRIDSGASGLQKTNYYFQGQSTGPALQSTFKGPTDKDYHIRDSLGVDALVWSPCGASRALNLNTQVRVTTRGNQRALMTIDSIDGQLTHKYGIQWRQCP